MYFAWAQAHVKCMFFVYIGIWLLARSVYQVSSDKKNHTFQPVALTKVVGKIIKVKVIQKIKIKSTETIVIAMEMTRRIMVAMVKVVQIVPIETSMETMVITIMEVIETEIKVMLAMTKVIKVTVTQVNAIATLAQIIVQVNPKLMMEKCVKLLKGMFEKLLGQPMNILFI